MVDRDEHCSNDQRVGECSTYYVSGGCESKGASHEGYPADLSHRATLRCLTARRSAARRPEGTRALTPPPPRRHALPIEPPPPPAAGPPPPPGGRRPG